MSLYIPDIEQSPLIKISSVVVMELTVIPPLCGSGSLGSSVAAWSFIPESEVREVTFLIVRGVVKHGSVSFHILPNHLRD